MKIPFRRFYPTLTLATVLVTIATLAPIASSARAPADVSLYNPGFDNHVWYWFSYVPGANDSFVPDGWHIWYKDGTIPFYVRVTTKHVDGKEAARGHAYWDDGRLRAGIYQVIDGTTPCLTYQFQMHGQSVASEDDDSLHALRVGIHPTGYSPSNVAVHDEYDEVVWGTSCADCVRKWEQVTVTAEAQAEKITVFTYANASGGSSHDIVWDAGSFDEVTPGLIPDPDNLPEPSGISNLEVITNSTSATVSWNTSREAISQVYYRLLGRPSTPVSPTGTLTHTVYLPSVSRAPNPWFSTGLDRAYGTSHSVEISGLQPGSRYQYFVAFRGVEGDACVTWVSDTEFFTTETSQ